MCVPRRSMSSRMRIVEDNEVCRRRLQRALEAAGFEVIAVPSAEDALGVLDGSTVDLLLTDHRLPGMNGVQLITRIKATHPALAIIAMTAHRTIESAVQARPGGAVDYLVKPFEVPNLLRPVHPAPWVQQSPACCRPQLPAVPLLFSSA